MHINHILPFHVKIDSFFYNDLCFEFLTNGETPGHEMPSTGSQTKEYQVPGSGLGPATSFMKSYLRPFTPFTDSGRSVVYTY